MVTLVICTASLFLFCCSCGSSVEVSPGMKVGSEGVDFAKQLVTRYPYRAAYSAEEKGAADFITETLKKMGYDPETVTFGKDKKVSQNIIVKIKGKGFSVSTSGSKTKSSTAETIRKQVIVGAHYDTSIGIAQKDKYPEFDGIQDNASGVGALISVAKELRHSSNGYDVVLVFFGAGRADFAGAKAYADAMTSEEKTSTDAMYCIESIYAGDRLYAHAGINSIQPGQKYAKRRKLYEISDVAIANVIDLRFNESDLDVDVNSDGAKDVYREITATKSDYSVFDNLNIPCVFLESYDYFESTREAQVESENPSFSETAGKIRGTNADSLASLLTILETDRLETRVKNTAFLIVKAIEKGMYQ